jgi:hypothetical protein
VALKRTFQKDEVFFPFVLKNRLGEKRLEGVFGLLLWGGVIRAYFYENNRYSLQRVYTRKNLSAIVLPISGSMRLLFPGLF